MAPKSDRKWCKTTPIRPIIASHLGVPSLFQLAILGPHKNHYAPSLVHQSWSSTALGISTLAYDARMIHHCTTYDI